MKLLRSATAVALLRSLAPSFSRAVVLWQPPKPPRSRRKHRSMHPEEQFFRNWPAPTVWTACGLKRCKLERIEKVNGRVTAFYSIPAFFTRDGRSSCAEIYAYQMVNGHPRLIEQERR